MIRLRAAAPAKVNLVLHVLERRPDGFHELRTLYQAIDLVDDVAVQIDAGARGTTLEVEGPEPGPAEENLTVRAVQGFRARFGLAAGVHVRLRKRIPTGAGLGGGSSDAGAVLRCLARAEGVDDRDGLRGVAAGLGSDVPFFLGRSALALGTGRGEIVEEIGTLPTRDLVVVLPPVHVPTAEAYLRLATVRAAERAPRSAAPPAPPPRRWSEVDAVAHNDFERVVAPAHEPIARSLTALRAATDEPVLVSGSGAASFGFFGDRASAEAAARRLEDRLGWPALAARTLTGMPAPE